MRHSIARAGQTGWRLLSSLTSRELARRPRRASPKPGLEALEERALLSVFHPNAVPFSADGGVTPFSSPSPTGTTPAQIRHAYGFDQITFQNGTVPGDGSGTTIAIVDAFDDPTIANDLHQFDLRFGLPDPTFTRVNQNGGSTLPAPNHGWASEIALDVEWAHAIAPRANILLVEANDNSSTNLFAAVRYAARQPGVVAVSISWGSGEFSGEQSSDSTFTTPSGHAGVTFVASSGDSGAPDSYPSASPNVLSVGGTTLRLDASGNILSESGWRGSGGGLSTFESQPSYQQGLVIHNGSTVISANGKRANPDVAYDSDPATGFPVYDTYNNPASAPWGQWGGTSAAAPQWAALIAIVNQGRALAGLPSLDGPGQVLPRLYQLPAGDFHDTTTGTSTGSPNYSAGPGYDLVTGLGTPVANLLVPHLIAQAPVLAQPPDQSMQAGQSLTVTLSATDPNGLPITYGATAGSQAYALRQQYGLFSDGNPSYNYGGQRDKWVQGANSTWYFLLPDGTFHQWDGTLNRATGPLIATLDRTVYANPSLLYNATATAGVVSVSGNQLTIRPPATFSGKLYVVASASNGFATAYRTFVTTVNIGTDQPPVLSPPADATIARNASYAVTLSATDPDGDPVTFSATVMSQAYALRQQYGLFSDGNLYFNYGGRQDKWFQGSGGAWFFILPDGTLYKWDRTANRATGPLYAALDPTYWADPSLVYNATPGATTSISGNRLTVTPAAGFSGTLYVSVTAGDGRGGSDSRTFALNVSGTANQPPVLDPIPDASIARGTSYTTTLRATDPDGDAITYSATAVSQAYQLRQQYGFFSDGNLWLNYGGRQEKWFQGNVSGTNQGWYFILPSGAVYAWDGTPNQATGTQIAILQTAYYNDPTLLYNATVGATTSVSGNQLTVTPDANFVGRLTVTATASDGLATDSKSFTLTVA